jgi:hypothetical protein
MVSLRRVGVLCNSSILFHFWSSDIVLPRIGAANRELNCRVELISADEDKRGRILGDGLSLAAAGDLARAVKAFYVVMAMDVAIVFNWQSQWHTVTRVNV